MGRKEKKLKFIKKKAKVKEEILKIIKNAIENGSSNNEAFYRAEKWLNSKVKENPQEKSLYVAVAREFRTTLKTVHEEMKSKDKENDYGTE